MNILLMQNEYDLSLNQSEIEMIPKVKPKRESLAATNDIDAALGAVLTPDPAFSDTQVLDRIAHHPDATDQHRAAAQWHLMLGQAERVLGA